MPPEMPGKVIKYRIRFHKSYATMDRAEVEKRIKNLLSMLQSHEKTQNLAYNQRLEIELLAADQKTARVKLPSGDKIDICIPDPTEKKPAQQKDQYRFVPLMEGGASSGFARGMKKIISFLLPFRTTEAETVNIGILQEVLGTYPKDGTVTMSQALDYWIRTIKRDEVPSKETTQLVHNLEEAKQLNGQIEKMQGKNYRFDPDYVNVKDQLTRKLSYKINNLKQGESLYIPAGYWKEQEKGGHYIFQPLLIQVTEIAMVIYVFHAHFFNYQSRLRKQGLNNI